MKMLYSQSNIISAMRNLFNAAQRHMLRCLCVRRSRRVPCAMWGVPHRTRQGGAQERDVTESAHQAGPRATSALKWSSEVGVDPASSISVIASVMHYCKHLSDLTEGSQGRVTGLLLYLKWINTDTFHLCPLTKMNHGYNTNKRGIHKLTMVLLH